MNNLWFQVNTTGTGITNKMYSITIKLTSIKKLTFFLLSLITLTVNAQYSPQYTLETHPMYSDIWVMSHKDGVNHLNAKYGFFTFDTYKVKNVFENIDPDKVKSILLESYNQFRQDYGVNPIFEEDK